MLAAQVLGNAKGVVAAVISVFVFKNDVTAAGALGYFICVMGTALFTYVKVMEKLKETRELQEQSKPAAGESETSRV
jgi:hypothetical protein